MPRHTFSFVRGRRAKYLVILCLLVLSGVAAAAARGWLQPASTMRASVAPRVGDKEVLPAIVVTVTPRGFEPAEVSLPRGKFFLSVENRSGVRGLTLLLDPEHGNRVREFTQPEDELDWVDELDLTPGLYTLTAAGRPGWACRITVTAR